MKTSARQHAIDIHKSLGDTKVTLTTVQKCFRQYIDPRIQYRDLSEEERKIVYAKVTQNVLLKHRRYKRTKKDAIEYIQSQISQNYSVKLGGISTRFGRMLNSEGLSWAEMSDKEREAFEIKVIDALTDSQSSGIGLEKECYLDGVKVGSALELYTRLRGLLNEPVISRQLFTKQLIEKFSIQDSITRVELTKECASEHLTVAGHIKNHPRTINELATPSRLRTILEGLRYDGFIVQFNTVKSCYNRIMLAKSKKWKELNGLERDDVMKTVDSKMRDEGNERYRKNEWVLEVDGEERKYNGAQLHRLAQSVIEDNCLSRQPFLNRLKTHQVSDDNLIVNGNRIVDWPALIEIVSEWQKKLPATIYKISFFTGKYAGHEYVGATQCLLEERLNWHCIDAKREKHLDSERPMHLAIKNALEYVSLEEVLFIEALEENVPIAQVEGRETAYIKQIPPEKCLNSHERGGSIGGRGSLKKVLYNKEFYGLAEAYRIAANDHATDDANKFIGRVKSFYYGSAKTFDDAVEFAIAGRTGRKKRCDVLDYKVATERMTFKDIEKSDKYPDLDNVHKVRSKVLRHHSSLTALSKSGIDIEPILLGKIKPGQVTPNVDVYLESAPAEIKVLVGGASSWSELSQLIKVPKSTLRHKARRFNPYQFWKLLNVN